MNRPYGNITQKKQILTSAFTMRENFMSNQHLFEDTPITFEFKFKSVSYLLCLILVLLCTSATAAPLWLNCQASGTHRMKRAPGDMLGEWSQVQSSHTVILIWDAEKPSLHQWYSNAAPGAWIIKDTQACKNSSTRICASLTWDNSGRVGGGSVTDFRLEIDRVTLSFSFDSRQYSPPHILVQEEDLGGKCEITQAKPLLTPRI